MKPTSLVNKLLKRMEVESPSDFLGAHTRAWEFVNAVLKEEDERVSKELYKETDYESVNWQLLKADQAGQLRLIKKLQQLFKD
jgi:hypothetical protein